jgi:hypothetical protein
MLSGQNAAGRTVVRRGPMMQGKARLIMAATTSSMMVFMVTLIVTFVNLGLPSDFLLQWVKAYVIAYPIAAGTAYLVMPTVQRFSLHMVARIDGAA